MELSPEERKKIYEEEEAKLQAKKIEGLSPEEKQRIYEEERKKIKWNKFSSSLLKIGFTLFVIFLIINWLIFGINPIFSIVLLITDLLALFF